MVFKKKIIKIFPTKSRTLFCIFFCLLSPRPTHSNNSNFSKILMTLHATAPKQYLHVPSAPYAFTLSFHSSPQSVLHSVLVCHLGRRQSMPWLGPTFLHAGWSADCRFHLLSHLFSMRTDNGQVFPVFLSSWASLIHLQNVVTSLKLNWKPPQVRLTDGQCDHVTGGQKY